MDKIESQQNGPSIDGGKRRPPGKFCAIVLLGLMLWIPCVEAIDEAGVAMKGTKGETAIAEDARETARTRKEKGVMFFWAGLGLAILFVLGSALALNGLGGKRPTHGDRDKGAGAP